jgi:hypothetical protein
MFKPYKHDVKILIDDGHGWRTYDSAMVAGNYNVPHARTFWKSLIKQGFTANSHPMAHTGCFENKGKNS